MIFLFSKSSGSFILSCSFNMLKSVHKEINILCLWVTPPLPLYYSWRTVSIRGCLSFLCMMYLSYKLWIPFWDGFTVVAVALMRLTAPRFGALNEWTLVENSLAFLTSAATLEVCQWTWTAHCHMAQKDRGSLLVLRRVMRSLGYCGSPSRKSTESAPFFPASEKHPRMAVLTLHAHCMFPA